jgi:hypothetical protein
VSSMVGVDALLRVLMTGVLRAARAAGRLPNCYN